MLKFIIRRVLGFIPVILAVVLFTFVLARALPGGPFDFAGDKSLPPTTIANLEAKYHLDWPQWKQFTSYMIGDELTFFAKKFKVDNQNVYVSKGMAVINGSVYEMDGKTICREGEKLVYGGFKVFDLDPEACGSSKGVLRGDLGPSFRYRGQTVNDVIKVTFPLSLQLGTMAIMLGLFIGIPAGIIAALKQNSIFDYSATFVAVLGVSVPSLVMAPVLIWIFAVNLSWLPAASWGAKPPYLENMFLNPGFDWVNYFTHAIMPVFAMGVGFSAIFARLTRASLLQVVREDYIRTARAKGLKESVVVFRHALRNSMIPVITVFGPLFAAVITGSMVIEQIFGLNGMGKHFINSITNRDYPILLGVMLVYTLILVSANLLVDIIYGWLDPRISYD
ncbi:MAG TPA: ABC transporter permease [Chloroflexi bacterium]|nr:ABC transporter permease [Chloroflexota bacterium]